MGRDFPPVPTGPGAHPASCKMGTGSFPGVKSGRGVTLTTHPLLVPGSWKSRAIPLPTFWATPRPVTSALSLYLYLYLFIQYIRKSAKTIPSFYKAESEGLYRRKYNAIESGLYISGWTDSPVNPTRHRRNGLGQISRRSIRTDRQTFSSFDHIIDGIPFESGGKKKRVERWQQNCKEIRASPCNNVNLRTSYRIS